MGGEDSPLIASNFIGPLAPNLVTHAVNPQELIVVNRPQLEVVATRMAGSALPFGLLVFILFMLTRRGRMAAIGRLAMSIVEVPFKVFDNVLERDQLQQNKVEPVNFWGNEPVPIKARSKKKNPYGKNRIGKSHKTLNRQRLQTEAAVFLGVTEQPLDDFLHRYRFG